MWNAENCGEFPRTTELLKELDVPFAVRGVCFARQSAGSGVEPHSDGRNFILTSHLGLKIPDGELCVVVLCMVGMVYCGRVFVARETP